MINLGKRTWRPFAAVSVALVSGAMVLATSTGAGAVSKTAAAPAAASLVAPGNELATTSAVRGLTSTGVPVTGQFTPRVFAVNSAGKMVARGTLNLLVRSATPQRISTVASVPVQSVSSGAPASGLTTAALASGTCDILNLVLGPLHLDLLGLVIDLNRVILNITAVAGAGNLLGNLLCAVAGLLDGSPLGSQLGQIADLLNAILAILNQ